MGNAKIFERTNEYDDKRGIAQRVTSSLVNDRRHKM